MSPEGKVFAEKIEKLVSLPSIPAALMKIQSIIGNPDSDLQDLAQAILKDPAITLKVLRIANSALYGLQCEVSSISQAVGLLGFKIINNIVTSAVVFDKFGDVQSTQYFDAENFWKHSMRCAVIAKSVAARADLDGDLDTEDFYIAGLLHDIGTIILLNSIPDKFNPILKKTHESGCPLHQVEMDHFGFNHAFVGAHLANKWNLPETVSHSIRFHHDPDNVLDAYGLGSVVYLADRLSKKTEQDLQKEQEHDEDQSLILVTDRLGLAKATLSEIAQEIEEKCQQIQIPRD